MMIMHSCVFQGEVFLLEEKANLLLETQSLYQHALALNLISSHQIRSSVAQLMIVNIKISIYETNAYNSTH
jgi:hypothetical protein